MQTRKTVWSTQVLAAGAISIAMSFLLSYLRLFSMPAGGSVTAASMLPLLLFAWMAGFVPGITAGAAYGLLQLIQRPEIVHWAQLVIDYPLAFAALGLAACFRNRKERWALPAGILIACFVRFLCHTLTGILFFGEYAPAADLGSVIAYSAGYNGGYMGVETAVSMAIAALPAVQAMAVRLRAQLRGV